MSEPLPIPPELEHLIEKRLEPDPRETKRRTGHDQRDLDLGPLGAIESAEDLEDVPTEDRRTGKERREDEERRLESRREGDSESCDPESSDGPPAVA